MEYTDVLFTSPVLIWYSTRKYPEGFDWQHFDDLTPHNLGVISGHSYGKEIDRVITDGKLTLTPVTSAEQMFTMLARGRIDLALANVAVGFALVNKEYAGTGEILAAKMPADKNVYHIAFSKKSPKRRLIPLINTIILDLRREGVIDQVIRGE